MSLLKELQIFFHFGGDKYFAPPERRFASMLDVSLIAHRPERLLL